MTLGTVLRKSAVLHAARTALWVDETTISYEELLYHAFGIANAIVNLPQRRTAIFANRHFWSYAGIAGAVLGGHAYVPLNPQHPLERQAAALRSAEVGAFVVDHASLSQCRELIEGAEPMLIIIPDGKTPDWAIGSAHWFLDEEQLSRDWVEDPAMPSDGAYLLFTSGSTGTPKGVMVSHENVMAYLDTACVRYRLTPEDRTTQLFDLTFDLSVHDLFVTWATGATLYCPPDGIRKAPQRFVQQHDLTCWFSTPATVAFMSRLRMLNPNEFPSLRLSLFCGEALPTALARRWKGAAPQSVIENLYGPTEATIAITAFALPETLDDLPDIVPIGHPFPGQEIRVLNEELIVGGSQVALGYWRAPWEQTAAKFVQHRGRRWYATGDRVELSDAYGLCFLGRLDRQVKILGNRVELFEVERVLREAAGSDTVAAIAWPMRDGIAQGIAGFVQAEQPPDADLVAACRSRLPPYMIPSRIIRVPEWPLNSNGKTDYRTLESIVAREV